MLYVHVGVEEVFAGVGFHMPPPPMLHALRAGMSGHAADWMALRRGLSRRGLELERGGSLVRVPRGFEAAPPEVQEDLKLKSWIVRQDIPRRIAGSVAMVEAVAGLALSCADLLEFGSTAIESA